MSVFPLAATMPANIGTNAPIKVAHPFKACTAAVMTEYKGDINAALTVKVVTKFIVSVILFLVAFDITELKIISAKIVPNVLKGAAAPLLIKFKICVNAFSVVMVLTQPLSLISILKPFKKSSAVSGR